MEKLIPLPTGVTLNVNFLGTSSKVPLVVLHGGPSWNHHYLLPGIEPVAADRYVIAPDLRGCGRSSRDLPIEQYQPELAVDDVIALVECLGYEQVDLLGFSTGGQWAQLLVERRPDLVRRLILSSTTAYADFYEELHASPDYQSRAKLPKLAADEGDDLQRTIAWARNGVSTSIWDLGKTDAYLALLDSTILTGDWLAPFEQRLLHPHRPADPEAVLRDFGGPVLLLHGRRDLTFPVSVAQRLHAAVPHSSLVVLDNCGHQAQFEDPNAWAAAVHAFLA